MQNLSYENEFDMHENEPVFPCRRNAFLHDWFRTKTPFGTEAKNNSGMA